MNYETKIEAAIKRSGFPCPAMALRWVRDAMLANKWFVVDLKNCRFTTNRERRTERFSALATICVPDADKTVLAKFVWWSTPGGKFKRKITELEQVA